MKIWIKVLVGITIGIILGVFLPVGGNEQETMDYISKLLIRIGRYIIFPLVFFSLVIGTYELKREKKLFSVYGRIILYLLLAAVLLVAIGIVTVLIFSPERIPIIIEEEQVRQNPGVREMLLAIFPKNLFQVLVGNGEILLPLIVLAFIIGVNLTFDQRVTGPVVQFFDSLSRVFYHINSLLSELFGFAMVVISAFFIMLMRGSDLSLFKQVLIILAIDCALIIFVVYPGLLYLLGGWQNPYKWLYALMVPALIAFFTRDEYLVIGMLAKHGKESLGVPRRVGSAVYPIFAFFGRAGTALVASVTFILVLRSYSSLEITFLQVLMTFGFSLLISLSLGSVPGMGSFVALSLLCGAFGKGMQEGYLILKPIAPIMISFGTLLDIITSGFVSLLVSRHVDLAAEVDLVDYV